MTKRGKTPKRDKNGSSTKEHGTMMIRNVMETPAWRALTPTAQSAYVWVRLEWKGPQFNNNGSISISVRQIQDKMGLGSKNTAAKALQDLQSKGFIRVTREAELGVEGKGKSHQYEITEIAMPNGPRGGSRQYKEWKKGSDFPVASMQDR